MAQSFFRVGKGVQLDNVAWISGAGVPGGGDADLVAVGSIYTNETNGSLYQKVTAGTGTDKWERKLTQTDLDSVSSGTSWREPADLHDETTTTLAAVITDANTDDLLDGVTVVAGLRVLLTGLTGDNKNVYIVGGSTGAWTLTEDTNLATVGDTLYVGGGTHAGHRHTYNGTDWVQTDQASNDELSFIRSFIGKTSGGAETPTYTGTNYITNGDTLEAAAGKLDTQLKTTTDATGTNATNISNLQSAVSTNTGNISTIQGEQTTQNTNISNNASAITTIQGEQTTQNTNITNAQNDATTALNRVGDTTDYTSNIIVTDGDSAATAIGKLDAELSSRIRKLTAAAVTTAATVDSVLVDNVDAVEWLVTCTQASAPANKFTVKIIALHDGSTGADATEVDWNEFARLTTGSTISGLDFNVTLTGTAGAQAMNLRVNSTASVNVKIIRIAS
jgi:hypothetical protein